MTILINPGSGPVPLAGKGWTNTSDGAEREAEKWLARMHAEGMTDVELGDCCSQTEPGRWTFYFNHKVTGVTVELDTHGIDNTEAYEKDRVFLPRVYWNGSSVSEPELKHFAAPGFDPVMTYRRTEEKATKNGRRDYSDNNWYHGQRA